MKPLILSKKEVRLLALQCQGLHSNDFFGQGKSGALKAIEHLGYVQIDTLAVVARAHHHTLWSRVKNYSEQYLNELLEKDKKIFEHWSHAASYLPMSEFRFSLPRKQVYADGKSHWFNEDKKIKQYVFDRIKTEGALQSRDFEYVKKKPGQWWEWKPAKRALEQLFMEGALMVSKRQGFQKVYDLTERVLPSKVNTAMPSEKENAEYLIKKAIASHGIVAENEIYYLRRSVKLSIQKQLNELVEKKEIILVKIKDIDKTTFYTTPQNLRSINKASPSSIHLLSPFDNVLIQRKRVQQLFDFNYQIECYVPEPKRIFGYFCLPILIGDEFIGRMDPKADRKSKTFFIKNLFIEREQKKFEQYLPEFCNAVKNFAEFNGCEKISIEHTQPSSLLKKICKELIKPRI